MGERARGLEAARVAEILVRRPDGLPGRRGSGYRVGEATVLTAAHVVAGPLASLRVRFDADRPGEWAADARVVLLAESADVALLEITDPPTGAPPAGPPPYAAVPDADLTLPFSAMGFPRFKLREDTAHLLDDGSPSQYRDSCHVSGTVSVLSNRREGTLELAVVTPPADVEPDRSPWEGMSGAVVWCGGRVIGVVRAHHRSDGLGRLAAGRVERWYDTLTPAELELLQRYGGLPPRPELALAPSLPDGAHDARPAPAPLTGLPTDLPLRELAGLVDALTALPMLRGGTGTALLLDSIDDRVAANAPRDPRLRMDLYGIVRTCLRYPGTLDQLLEAVRLLEGPSPEVERMDRAAGGLAGRDSARDGRRDGE
ncbi:MAG: trypsin-like peptidase domain-containing protein [Streptomyces sp.]|nr:trypsin-like peptidase domain-containing protein [Streptomyces sp.]NUT27073.1 trypsin-like peptidase domain-containing protein [Streptomyces sp.]